MLTIVPVFINANHYLSFFRIARIARILRLLKPNKTLHVVITGITLFYKFKFLLSLAIQRQTFILLFTVFCLIFIATGLINMVEKIPGTDTPLPFHTALYCVVVVSFFNIIVYISFTFSRLLLQLAMVILHLKLRWEEQL